MNVTPRFAYVDAASPVSDVRYENIINLPENAIGVSLIHVVDGRFMIVWLEPWEEQK